MRTFLVALLFSVALASPSELQVADSSSRVVNGLAHIKFRLYNHRATSASKIMVLLAFFDDNGKSVVEVKKTLDGRIPATTSKVFEVSIPSPRDWTTVDTSVIQVDFTNR